MPYQIQMRRDTQANWEQTNPVLAEGELGLDLTTKAMKMGDGSTPWNGMPYMLKQSPFVLGACGGMSVVFGEGTNYICWTDPEDVVFNGATMARWKRTSLVRKAGGYPASETDGTIIAQTSGNNRNAYRVNAFEDTTAVPGTTYHYKLFSVSDMDAANNLAANELPVTDTLTPEMIHGFSQAGTLLNYMSVGDLIVVHHPEFDPSDGYDGQLVRFMGYDCVLPADGSGYQHAAVFQFEDCLHSTELNYSAMQFDPAEPQYANTFDTSAKTGKTYYVNAGSSYVALTEGTDWEPSDTSCTYGGTTYTISEWYEKNPNPNYGSGTNKFDIALVYQYMNADAPANSWWTPLSTWDVGAYKSRNGFLYNLPFKDLLVPIKKIVARSTTYGGGSVTMTCKVFLPSMYEVFGTAINGVNEGVRRWDYYATYTDAKYRIKLRNGEPSIWWLSSPYASNGYFAYHVTTSGSCYFNLATSSYGVAPAFAL